MNIHHWVVSWKHKLVSQKTNTKTYECNKKNIYNTKNKKCAKSNILSSIKFTLLKHHNIKKITNLSFASKQKNLKEFKTKLQFFYNKTEGIKLTNENN